MTGVRDLSLGRRLALAFGALLLLAALFAGAMLAWLSENGTLVGDYSQRVVRQVARARALERNVLETSIAFRTYLLAPSAAQRDTYDAVAARNRTLLAELEAAVHDPQVAARIARFKDLLARYDAETADAFAHGERDGQPAAAALREQMVLEVRALSLEQEAAGDRALATVQANRMAIVRSVWIFGGLLVLALGAIGTVTTLAIRQPARRLARVAQKLQHGDWRPALALPAEAGDSGDEMRQLEAAIGAAARALEQRERELREQGLRIQEQNESLQAQNEEIQAQNEEIQAQNEEIRAQGEELEAQNEELRAQSRQLRTQARELEDADARKNEFLGILAHELRNPLAPITNGLELLRTLPSHTPGYERARGIVDRQVRHLTRLVDDLLDVTRISHGKITLRMDTIDLAELVGEVVHEHRDSAQRQGIILEERLPPGPLRVDGDRTRLRQVFGNLVGNALKFTPPKGRVVVTLEADGAQGVVRVCDDGIGMDEELLARLFQPFSQAKAEPGRPHGGLGLGLALARALVTLHGGEVEAASPGRGRGTEVVVRLPQSGRAPAAAAGEGFLRLASRSPEGLNAVK